MGMLLAALGIAQGISSITQGYAQSSEAKYNAKVKEKQAELIGTAQEIEAQQYGRQMNRAMSTSVARTGKSGFTMSGSPMAVLLDTQSQMEMDKAIGQYNLEIQKSFALSEASMYKAKAKNYRTQGNIAGFSQILLTGLDYGMKSGWGKSTSIGNVQGGVGGKFTGVQSAGGMKGTYFNKSYPTWSPR